MLAAVVIWPHFGHIGILDCTVEPVSAAVHVARLGIPAGTPVAEHIRTGYTSKNRPVRLMTSIVPGDTLILQYTIPT